MNGKKKHLIIIIVIISIASSISIFYGYHKLSERVPIIEVTPTSYDFGEILPDAVGHDFIVKNIGKASLKIYGVSTSCGCTMAHIDSENILPDKEANLTVIFNPDSMGHSIRGEVHRVVYIRSNDPKQPEFEISIKANVVDNIK